MRKKLELPLPEVDQARVERWLATDNLCPEGLTLYGLRHSAATLLLAAATNPKIVAERLGHSSITTTMDTYSHVLPDMQRDAITAMERTLGIG